MILLKSSRKIYFAKKINKIKCVINSNSVLLDINNIII